MTDNRPAEIRVEGLDGEVLVVTVWTYEGAGGHFQFELYLDADDVAGQQPIASIEISTADAMRLAMGLAGTAQRAEVTAPEQLVVVSNPEVSA